MEHIHSILSQHFAGLSNSPNSTSPSGFSSEESVVSSFYSEFGCSTAPTLCVSSCRGSERPRWLCSITNVSMSTSPAHTTFIIENLKKSYQTGEELFVTVHAKDFNGKSKSYGGDFFQAKESSTENVPLSQASVFGEVVDLLNGSYSVRFLLPWVGKAQVAVRLIHSSEAVQVLKHHRDTDSDRVFFNGYYEGPGPNKTRLNCCCEYKDPHTEEIWRCQRPKSLPCSARVYHSMGGYRNRLTEKEKKLMTPHGHYIQSGAPFHHVPSGFLHP
uniref:Uncharacterized protein n=1 Tax=Cyprinus carpio TaxID=7962 RepID=A0A8C1QXP1_CYPCA